MIGQNKSGSLNLVSQCKKLNKEVKEISRRFRSLIKIVCKIIIHHRFKIRTLQLIKADLYHELITNQLNHQL